MKYTVMENFDSDLFAGKRTTSIVENNSRYRIVTKSRRCDNLRISALDFVSLAFASSEDSPLFHLDECSVDRQLHQKFVGV